MELTITETRPNPLLKRTEYRFEVSHTESATPQRDAVRGEVAKLVKVPKERVVIERMRPRFGTPRTDGWAAAYESPEALRSVVRDHIQIRNGLKEKPAPAGAPTEAPAAPEPKPEPAAKAEPKPKAEAAGKPEPKAEAAAKPEPKAKPETPAKSEPKPKKEKAPADSGKA
ncbi:MAG TPA: hypothetical protein VFF67_08130 [Thermoplasmata archaeon]|nr:hypothetical protein [Thermoplasmata archaeon]